MVLNEKPPEFKPDTAYMEVPRCDRCRHWGRSAGVQDNSGAWDRCRLIGQLWHGSKINIDGDVDLVQTAPDFGCVQWADVRVRAPWTAEQVDTLNLFQRLQSVHPFTCGAEDCGGVLIATPRGWVCGGDAACMYTQDWAHYYMADAEYVKRLMGTCTGRANDR